MDNDKLDELERVARAIDRHMRDVVEPGDLIWSKPGGSSVLAINAARDVLALITAARRPDDMVLVPREPTEAMHEAALDQLGRNPDRPDEEIDRIYRAMLSAAPKKEPDHG